MSVPFCLREQIKEVRAMMQSSFIAKVEKSMRYAQERDRVCFSSLAATFKGDHGTYRVEYREGNWRCTCSNFLRNGFCSHTMALQRILEGMVPAEASQAVA